VPLPNHQMTGEEPRIMSIAPSFNCMLKCEGCYLTTDVTKEMREATKPDYYWERAMELGVQYGYTELAMTLNPFPGAIEHAIKLAKTAKKVGFETVNVTMTWKDSDWIEPFEELMQYVDIITESVDENRRSYLADYLRESDMADLADKHYNLNILWSRSLMEAWPYVDYPCGVLQHEMRVFGELRHAFGDRSDMDATFTIQHLILKPLSLYGDFDFEGAYQKILETVPLAGDGELHVGDVAFGNLLGLNNCPGERMIDIDPMGLARRCPENPNAHDATTLANLESLLKNGIPGCGDACDCITG
jgi:MoaA/NifB/PqqE/SkfB family radical SAM enzyme